MSRKYDVVIIGGGPGGVTTALSARNTYRDKSILLIRRETKPMIPCGIPYVLHTLEGVDQNILPDAPLDKNGIEKLIEGMGEVGDHHLITESGERIEWDRLVLATGSEPFLLPIPGSDLNGVYTVSKRAEEIEKLRKAVDEASAIAVIGGGFIGVEVSDELLRKGKKLILVEKEESLLPTTMDPEFGKEVREILTARGAEVICGVSVKSIDGQGSVSSITLEDGRTMNVDVVIMAVGYRPSTTLAQSLGLEIHPKYGIVTDDYMRTSMEHVFAVGDAVAKRHFLMGDYSPLMLASTAMAQGRVVGANLFDIKVLRGVGGILGTFSTKVGDTAFAATGLTESQAKRLGIEYVVGYHEAVDRHPGKLPGAHKQRIKLIFSRHSHVLLGAQVAGGDSVGEMINMLALMIQNRMTDNCINTMQIGTHPLLTASPIAYPLINATVNAILKRYE